jgi:hypothetical protein
MDISSYDHLTRTMQGKLYVTFFAGGRVQKMRHTLLWMLKPWRRRALHRDPSLRSGLLAKVPGPCPDASGNTTSPYCRAVIRHISFTRIISQLIRLGQTLWTNLQQIRIELCYWIYPNLSKSKLYG